MTCVSKEYQIKKKMEQELCLQLKILFLLGYNLKLCFSGGGIDFWLGGRESTGGIFLGGGGMNTFLAGGGGSDYSIAPSRKNPLPYFMFVFLYTQ